MRLFLRYFLFVALLVFWSCKLLLAQTSEEVPVGFADYMEMVKQRHPVARQAELMLEVGDATLRQARGSFDPVLKSDYDYKQYDGKEYYRINNNEIKWPTSLGGVALKAGYENNQGNYLNPENSVPGEGLAYAGFAVPLGAGLFFDERRLAIRQAEVFERSADLERTLMINELIFDASKAYWDWYIAWNTYQTYIEGVRLAEERFDGIKQNFEQGDLPAIDTLEAFILVQNRELSKNEAQITLAQARYQVDNFLWSEDLKPLQLQENTRPVYQANWQKENSDELVESVLDSLDQIHPQMQFYANKVEMLQFDRRMKAEKIKPKLNFNYNVLNEPVGARPQENFSSNNYKWGFEFSMPLLLRQERGALQLAKLKINDADLTLRQKSMELSNKIRAYQAELKTLNNQISLYNQAVDNYRALLAGERRKFDEGESSLFLVNSRESSLIGANVKLIELQGKYQKAMAGLIMAMGGIENSL